MRPAVGLFAFVHKEIDAMSVFFMDFDMAPSVIWARDLYDQMQIRSDFRKWFPRMCQYGFVEGRDYEFVPRVRPQDEGGRTVQRYVKDYCRDISMRVRSHLDVKRKEGQFIGSFAGYGYQKDPKDKNHLIIDEYAAGIVQEIVSHSIQPVSQGWRMWSTFMSCSTMI